MLPALLDARDRLKVRLVFMPVRPALWPEYQDYHEKRPMPRNDEQPFPTH